MNEAGHAPIEYLRIFFRRKWFIIIPTFAGIIFGICAGVVLPKQYKSSTTILVEEGKTDNPLFDNIAISSTVKQRLYNIRESMLGWQSLVELVKRLNLDKDVKSPERFEQLIFSIRKNIIISLRGTNIIDLSYVGDMPEMTQAVVKNVTEIFINRNVNVQNQETKDAIKFIEEQLRVYRGKIKSAEIAQLKDRLGVYLVDSTENHPVVRQLRDQIGKKMEELNKENLEYQEDVILSADSTNPMISEIKKALETLGEKGENNSAGAQKPSSEKDLYKVVLLDRLDSVMARDVGVNESIYNALLHRLEQAKITQRLQSSKEGTKYTIINPPLVPHQPFRPNVFVVALVGLLIGAGIGAGLVFLMEFLDKSFLDIHDAKTFLGVPLLGAISKINTPESLLEENQKHRWIVFWMFSGGIFVIAFTLIVNSFMK